MFMKFAKTLGHKISCYAVQYYTITIMNIEIVLADLIVSSRSYKTFTLRQVDWACKKVPPPTVPTSKEGMVQLIYRS